MFTLWIGIFHQSESSAQATPFSVWVSDCRRFTWTGIDPWSESVRYEHNDLLKERVAAKKMALDHLKTTVDDAGSDLVGRFL